MMVWEVLSRGGNPYLVRLCYRKQAATSTHGSMMYFVNPTGLPWEVGYAVNA